jgi:hypothetical protein
VYTYIAEQSPKQTCLFYDLYEAQASPIAKKLSSVSARCMESRKRFAAGHLGKCDIGAVPFRPVDALDPRD